MSDVSELVTVLGEMSKATKAVYTTYKELKAQEDSTRLELMDALHQSGLLTAKTSEYTASIAKRPQIVIAHEQSVLDWLKETPDIETDQYIGLRTTNFKTLAMSMLKNTGEIVPGTEFQETESISIRANKK